MADYDYLKVSDGSGDAALMHIESDRDEGSTTIEVDSVAGAPQKFIATMGTLLASGYIDPTTKLDFLGHIDGDNLEIDSFEPGSTDVGNTEGQVVIIKPNTGWANRVADFIENATDNGTPEDVTFDDVTSSTITTSGDASVGGAATVTGKLTVSGSVQSPAATTATVDGSGNITPSKQIFDVTALDANMTLQAPTFGTWNGAACVVRIFGSSSHTIAFASGYTNQSGLDTPTSTVAGKWMTLGIMYNSTTSKWQILSISQEA